VEKNRRRIMYYSRPPEPQQPSRNWPRTPARPATGTSVALSTHPPSGALPCHESPHARPRSDGQHEARGREGGPEAACIRTHITPLGFMLALRTSGAGGWEFGDTIVPGGRLEPGGHGRVRGRADGCADGLAAWLLFVGGPWGYTTPVLLHFMHLGKNLRAGRLRRWNGLYLVRRDICLVEQTGYVPKHAGIVSCTLTLPSYPIQGGILLQARHRTFVGSRIAGT